MPATDDNPTPAHSVLRRLITPWEYRHLHAVASVRLAAGGFQLGVGLVLLSLGRKAETGQERRKMFRLSTVFLVSSALQFSGGVLDMAVARSSPPRS